MTHNRDSEVCIDQAIAGIVALGHDIVTCGESFVESFVTAMDISSALALECNVENDSQREFLWTPCLPKFSESCAFAGIRPARTIALILAMAGCWTLVALPNATPSEYLVLKKFSISARQSTLHNLVASLTTSDDLWVTSLPKKHMRIWDQKKKTEIHGPPWPNGPVWLGAFFCPPWRPQCSGASVGAMDSKEDITTEPNSEPKMFWCPREVSSTSTWRGKKLEILGCFCGGKKVGWSTNFQDLKTKELMICFLVEQLVGRAGETNCQPVSKSEWWISWLPLLLKHKSPTIKTLIADLDGKIRIERKELWITIHSRKSSAMLIIAVCLDCLCLPASAVQSLRSTSATAYIDYIN